MTSMTLLMLVLAMGFQQAEAPRAERAPVELTRVVDDGAAERCIGSLVGFSNVPVQCTVAADGSMRQCELLTQNEAVLRYRSRFECMAAATRVYGPDGAPAVGRVVRMTMNGRSEFYRPRQ
ncbi:hypothetical protein [Brevundimonas sp. GCM10030266]|uniref:hypothetical protein n=1 Tax=Brevundimonas sp. GCM10030266 TaxID=3273386 RepID=UPI0036068053